MKWLVNGMVWESLGFGRRDGFTGIVLNISFFDATEEGGYIIKIHRKNAIVVSMQIKFRKKFHRGIYANKIHVKDTIAVPIY